MNSIGKIPKPVSFEWDKANSDKNWAKHKVSLKECEQVFFNKPVKLFRDPKHSQIEERLLAYGITNSKRQLTLVFTIRTNKIRIISARDQSKNERGVYAKK